MHVYDAPEAKTKSPCLRRAALTYLGSTAAGSASTRRPTAPVVAAVAEDVAATVEVVVADTVEAMAADKEVRLKV